MGEVLKSAEHFLKASKASLDKDWTTRANAVLGKQGLSVEVCAFYTSDGKNTSPHLVLQFTKTDNYGTHRRG